jgi:hypothetical protein
VSNVRRIDGPKPVSVPSLPENDMVRGVALMHSLLARVPLEQSRSDGDHIIRAIRRLGEIADAHEFGHADIDAEVEDAIVSLLRWRLDRAREAAR